MKINWVIQYKLRWYLIGSTDKTKVNEVVVSSCYASFSDIKENSHYFRERSNVVLSVYPNKFFVRMLKYV